ncbi:MAG: hypothetical protein IPL95_07690, partial [Saprospiraceae bacterium]|nr:hypothetical protein [Saprospiraceae bacterium]
MGSPGVVQISGPKQNDLVYPGIYNICYKVTDATNTTATCCFNYEVRAYSGPISNTLVCNDFLNVSLDTLCSAVLNPDMLLEGGPYKCYDTYKVEVSTWNAVIDPTYTFTVTNTGSAWTGDQRAVLISPSGQVIRLNGDQAVLANNYMVGPGAFGCANTGSRVTYSNTSTVSPATLTCANPVVGTCKPLDALPALPAGPGVCGPIYGSSVNGTWTLRVWDDFPGDALGNMQGCFNFTSTSTVLPNGLFLGKLAEYNDKHNFNG